MPAGDRVKDPWTLLFKQSLTLEDTLVLEDDIHRYRWATLHVIGLVFGRLLAEAENKTQRGAIERQFRRLQRLRDQHPHDA